MPKKSGSSQASRRPPIIADPAAEGSPSGLRIATYHRVSTADQDPQLARAELDAWAARQGGSTTRLILDPKVGRITPHRSDPIVLRIEESASGAWNARPGLQRLLAQVRNGKIDVVAVWKLDRFGRSALDVLTNIQALADAGVRFVAVTQGIDIKPGGDAMSRLMLTVLAAVAEFERDLIRERTRLGLAKARARGARLGRPRLSGPSGERVRELRAEGKSWAQIAAILRCTIGLARLRATE